MTSSHNIQTLLMKHSTIVDSVAEKRVLEELRSNHAREKLVEVRTTK